MSTDFGDIAAYHRHEASRHYALAQDARERGDLGKVEYFVSMALRHAEAAHEQQQAMMFEPGPSILDRMPLDRTLGCQPAQPKRGPSASARSMAVLRGAGQMFAAIHKSIAKRHEPFQGLSLR